MYRSLWYVSVSVSRCICLSDWACLSVCGCVCNKLCMLTGCVTASGERRWRQRVILKGTIRNSRPRVLIRNTLRLTDCRWQPCVYVWLWVWAQYCQTIRVESHIHVCVWLIDTHCWFLAISRNILCSKGNFKLYNIFISWYSLNIYLYRLLICWQLNNISKCAQFW